MFTHVLEHGSTRSRVILELWAKGLFGCEG